MNETGTGAAGDHATRAPKGESQWIMQALNRLEKDGKNIKKDREGIKKEIKDTNEKLTTKLNSLEKFRIVVITVAACVLVFLSIFGYSLSPAVRFFLSNFN
ncbi:MAG: hypothetical protein OXC26_13915 [Albidovulum sp.]|nr:hypothetical protein [Albidovulum sp.]